MLKIYIGTPIPNLPKVLDYAPNLELKVVSDVNECDYLLVPHNWTHIRNNKDFLKQYVHSSKKTIIFWFGDSDAKVSLPNVIVFRTSGYKKDLLPNEIIMPTVIKISEYINGRPKSAIPSVGFMGWAKQTGFSAIKTSIKNLFLKGPYKKGIYFRKAAMQALIESPLVTTDFVVSDKYHQGSTDEYVRNIEKNDFTLSPKGDGNYSARFYEVLSLGRIPILIDTDCVLPLENEINYDELIVRVPYKDITNTAKYVCDFYNKIDDDEFKNKQVRAREVFENYLKIDKYLAHVLTTEFLNVYNNMSKK